MNQNEQKVTFKEIQEEFEEVILSCENWLFGIWIFVAIYFTNYMIDEANGALPVRNFVVQFFGIIPTYSQVWIFWYLFIYSLVIICFTLFEKTLEILYKKRPDLW